MTSRPVLSERRGKLVVAFIHRTTNPDDRQRWDVLTRLVPPSLDLRAVDAHTSEADLVTALETADVVIYWGLSLPLSVVSKCKRLKLVQLLSAGHDNVDAPELRRLGITVATNGGSNAVSVSEHTVGLMLCLCRRLMPAWLNTHGGAWRDGVDDLPLRSELSGKTVGLVGFGNTGRQVARRLSGFDVDLVYNDVIDVLPGREGELGATSLPLDNLLSVADVVSLHVPLTSATFHLISERQLQLMKSGALLVNTSRGGVVDEAALVRALNAGTIAGAALDVFEEEPPSPTNPLLTMANVVATPHWAGGTIEAIENSLRFCIANCLRLADGHALLSVVPDA